MANVAKVSEDTKNTANTGVAEVAEAAERGRVNAKQLELARASSAWFGSSEYRREIKLMRPWMKPMDAGVRVHDALHRLRFGGSPMPEIGDATAGVHKGWVAAIIKLHSSSEDQNRPFDWLAPLTTQSRVPAEHAELALEVLSGVQGETPEDKHHHCAGKSMVLDHMFLWLQAAILVATTATDTNEATSEPEVVC